jgi:sterol desaturase/sphingolipid hydroxylase (fatty acid hydroxylase superfamily)
VWFNPIDILLAAAVFLPIERLIALRPRKVLRRQWRVDVAHMIASGVLIRLGGYAVLVVALQASDVAVPGSWRAAVAGQPGWLQFIEVVLLADLGFYLAHRLFHAVPALWRIHSVHHSIEEMDWLAAHRVHPLDQIFTKTVSLLPVFALGFEAAPVAAFTVLYQWQSLLVHANVRMDFGPLRWVLASPHFHHWHHANERQAWDRNFAGQLPLWDVIFGTLYMPRGRMPERYGTDAPVPETYVGQLAYPFRSHPLGVEPGRPAAAPAQPAGASERPASPVLP